MLAGNGEINELITGAREIPQALLLAGPRGCGRNYAARLIAARYIEKHPEWVMNDTHPDCIVLRGQGASGQIPVKPVREALRESVKSPAAGSARAIIICDCESLNPASANALLKSLESPPDNLVFILTSEGTASVPATVLSRCELHPVREVSREECKKFVQQAMPQAKSADIEKAAEVFGGRIGLALKALSDRRRMEAAERALRLRQALANRDKAEIMAVAAPLKTREEAQTLLSDCMISLEQSGSSQAAELLNRAAESLRANMPLALCFAGLAAGI